MPFKKKGWEEEKFRVTRGDRMGRARFEKIPVWSVKLVKGKIH